MADPAAAYAHCEALLRGDDRDAWLAALLAPAAARPSLHALGAFALEVGRVRERVRQPVAGEIRLQWWQDVVDGQRATEASAHPVAAALVDTIVRAGLPRAPLGDMLDAHRMALYDEPPADLAALERQLAATHGVPVRLAARALGAGEAADQPAEHAGVALGLADLLDALRGERRPALPPSVVPADLRAAARARLARLRAGQGALGPAAPAVLRAALVEPRLRLGERAAGPLAPPSEPPQWRRQWRLWRAARRGGVL